MADKQRQYGLDMLRCDFGPCGNSLDRETELETIARAKDGDMEARKDIVKMCYPWVVRTANRYWKRYNNLDNVSLLEDLVQAGLIGVLKAIDKYDPSKNTRFITYATFWIRRECLIIVSGSNRIIRLPVKSREDHASENPAVRPVMSFNGVGVNKGKEDAEFDPEEPPRWYNVGSETSENIDALREYMKRLEPQEQGILYLYYRGYSLRVIGEKYGISKSGAGSIKNRAIDKLRRMFRRSDRLSLLLTMRKHLRIYHNESQQKGQLDGEKSNSVAG